MMILGGFLGQPSGCWIGPKIVGVKVSFFTSEN